MCKLYIIWAVAVFLVTLEKSMRSIDGLKPVKEEKLTVDGWWLSLWSLFSRCLHGQRTENINNSHLLPASRVVVDVITMIMMVHSIDNAT